MWRGSWASGRSLSSPPAKRWGRRRIGPQLKKAFGGVYIANEKFTRQMAQDAITAGDADAVAFGKMFIANPDLPRRLQIDAPLNEPRPELFYGGGPAGYTDYPALGGCGGDKDETPAEMS